MKTNLGKTSPKERLLTPGKLPHGLLAKMLSGLATKDPGVVLGPGMGIDAAVVRTLRGCLAVTSDPITMAGDLAAWYCVHVNANDLAVMGAIPRYMTVVGLLPPVPAKTVERITRDLTRFARAIGVSIIGGHTEITTTVNTPILIATMFGPLAGKKILSAASAQPGDLIVMTKTAGLEATAIIARERAEELKRAGMDARKLRTMQHLLFRPGISVLPEAKLAGAASCSALHDATEGGVLTALWEMAKASRVRMMIDSTRIPVLPLTAQACRVWGIDPLRVISSGTLLATIPPRRAGKFLQVLATAGIPGTVIGRVEEGPPGLVDTSADKRIEPCGDEIVKIYS